MKDLPNCTVVEDFVEIAPEILTELCRKSRDLMKKQIQLAEIKAEVLKHLLAIHELIEEAEKI